MDYFLSSNSKADKFGFLASFICAMHCATLPIFLTFLPLINLSFLANPLFEVSMIAISIIIAFYSLLPSYFKNHQNIKPISYMLLGFSLIALGHFYLESLESFIVPVGALFVAFSHLNNLKLVK